MEAKQSTNVDPLAHGYNNPRFSDKIINIILESDFVETTDQKENKTTDSPRALDTHISNESDANSDKKIHDRIHVNSLLLTSSSYFKAMFESKMKEGQSKEIDHIVEHEQDAIYFKIIVKYLYTKTIDEPLIPDEYLHLLIMADKLDMVLIFKECIARLDKMLDSKVAGKIINVPDYLTQGPLYQNNNIWQNLTKRAAEIMAKFFVDFDATWQSNELLNLSANELAYVINSDAIRVRSENTIYCAVRRWLTECKYSPFVDKNLDKELICIKLLDGIKFPFLSTDFLLDVVKPSKLFDVSEKVSKHKEALINSALQYHASSSKRKQIDPRASKILYSKRVPSDELQTMTFDHTVANVAQMVEGKYAFSPSFFLDGYWLRLQYGRIRWERADGFALALFLSLDLQKSGLDIDHGLFVQTESQFLGMNVNTRNYEPTHLPSFDTFTAGVIELGYFDVFKKSWAELTAYGSGLINSDGELNLRVRVKLLF